jgi:hypothetical protein
MMVGTKGQIRTVGHTKRAYDTFTGAQEAEYR